MKQKTIGKMDFDDVVDEKSTHIDFKKKIEEINNTGDNEKYLLFNSQRMN